MEVQVRRFIDVWLAALSEHRARAGMAATDGVGFPTFAAGPYPSLAAETTNALRDGAGQQLDIRLGRVAIAPNLHEAPHLLNAYVASAFEVALQAETLTVGAERLDIVSVDLIAAVREVVMVLRPLAESEGVMLLQDQKLHTAGIHQGDKRHLHSVLFHLVARALAAEQPGGHVRLSVACSLREVCVRILSRAPECSDTATYQQDLIAAQRVLQAMGGALVLEPRRAGYQPLCLVLGTPPSAAALRAA